MPIIKTPKHVFVSTFRCGLFFLTANHKEVAPLMVIETHHSIISVIQEYFEKKRLGVSSIRDHFTIVYHLLDEMVDGGYPFTTVCAPHGIACACACYMSALARNQTHTHTHTQYQRCTA